MKKNIPPLQSCVGNLKRILRALFIMTAGILIFVQAASAQTATLAVSVSPANAGAATGGNTYPVGTNVQIAATANLGWIFVAWNDGDTNSSRTVTVPAGGTNFTALFNLNQPAVSSMRFTTLAGTAGSAGSANGMIYVADPINHLIRQITSAGVVTTLAGTAGVAGSTNATGTAARFNTPNGVAVDGAGNVFVADTQNHLIRKISPAGVVTTVAGAGVAGSANGTGTVARFNTPYGIAVDGLGNLLVADTGNHTIRQITPDGTVSTLAGTAGVSGSADDTGAAARFYRPCSIAVDGLGHIFVADTFNHTLRIITAGGVVTTIAGLAGSAGSTDGTTSVARFNLPFGVTADHVGHVYIADSGNHTIREIDPAGAVSTLGGLAGNAGSADGEDATARFNGPGGVAANSAGNVFVADTYNHTIRQGSFIQTTDVEVTAFSIQFAAGNVLGQSPTNISLTVRNNGPWDLATNRFNLEIDLRNEEWSTLGNYQFPLALQAGQSATLSIPPSSVIIPSNYWMGTWSWLVFLSPSNSALIGPHFNEPFSITNSVRIPGFFKLGWPTLNGVVTRDFTVPPGTNISGSFTASMQNGEDPSASLTAVIGFVNSSNQWVGGEPQVLYSGVPPITNTQQNVTWTNLAPPTTPGSYRLFYKAYLTWEQTWCISQFKSSPPTFTDFETSYHMEGRVATVNVLQPTDLQAIGMNLALPSGDPRGQHPATISVFLENNGPGAWDWNNCLVEAYLAAQGAPQSAWLNLGRVNLYPLIAVGQTTTNALTADDLLQFALPLYLPGGTYTTWLHITPQSSAPQDTNTNDNWAAGNTVLVPNYTPRGVFNFTTWLGKLWTIGSADGVGGNARFYSPYSVTADNFGNYYIAAAPNHTLR
ncbi:MAG: hypothetical protein NTY53_21640, partial [Kiritimatiellaeota bacterium]|nr:hypothetical protein [Kiritimatiellota bacterium]